MNPDPKGRVPRSESDPTYRGAVPLFLTPEWIAALGAALAAAPVPAHEPFPSFTLHHVVSGPDTAAADRGYAVTCDDIGFRVVVGSPPAPGDLVFRTDYATAVALQRGELSAQEALESGRLEVRGRLDRITGARKVLVALDDAARELRAITTYDLLP